MPFNGTVEKEYNKLTEDQKDSIYHLMILFNQGNDKSGRKRSINLDSFTRRTDRGQHVEEYMHEMRDNDRI